MRQLYLAATGQNRGKTTAALGLFNGFVARGLHAGFMKPVGQRTVDVDGLPADEDVVLMRETFGLQEPYSVLSPVHIPRGFTKSYIAGEVVEDLGAKIRRAHATFASSSAACSQFASTPTRKRGRAPNAVAAGSTRSIAPPWYQTSIVEWWDGARPAASATASIAPSPSSSRSADFQ